MSSNGLIPKEILLGTTEQAADYVQTIRTLRAANVDLSKQADAQFRSNGLLFVRELEKFAQEDAPAPAPPAATGPTDVNASGSFWDSLTSPAGLGVAGGVLGGGVAAVNELRKKEEDRNWWNTLIGAGIGGGVGYGGAHLMNLASEAAMHAGGEETTAQQLLRVQEANPGKTPDEIRTLVEVENAAAPGGDDDKQPSKFTDVIQRITTDLQEQWGSDKPWYKRIFPLPPGGNALSMLYGGKQVGSLLDGGPMGVFPWTGGLTKQQIEAMPVPRTTMWQQWRARAEAKANMPDLVNTAVNDAKLLVDSANPDMLAKTVNVDPLKPGGLDAARAKVDAMQAVGSGNVLDELQIQAKLNAELYSNPMSARRLAAAITDGTVKVPDGVNPVQVYVDKDWVHTDASGQTIIDYEHNLRAGHLTSGTPVTDRHVIRAALNKFKTDNPIEAVDGQTSIEIEVRAGEAPVIQTAAERTERLTKLRRVTNRPPADVNTLLTLQNEVVANGGNPGDALDNQLELGGHAEVPATTRPSPIVGGQPQVVPRVPAVPGTIKVDFTPTEVAQLKLDAIKVADPAELEKLWIGRSTSQISVTVDASDLDFNGAVTLTKADIQAAMAGRGGSGPPLSSSAPLERIRITMDNMEKFFSSVQVDVSATGSVYTTPAGTTIQIRGDHLLLRPAGTAVATVQVALVKDFEGELIIDPVAFSKMKRNEQLQVLRNLQAIDLASGPPAARIAARKLGRLIRGTSAWGALFVGLPTDIWRGLDAVGVLPDGEDVGNPRQ
jgi:hypothetical protein